MATGIVAVHVPYKGTPEALAATVAGDVDFFFAPASSVLPHIKSGALLALAVDESGKAVVMIDERAPVVATRSANGTADIWATTKSPAQISFAEDLGKTKLGISPPRNGTSFRVVDSAPTTDAVNRLPVDTVMKIVASDAPKRGLPPSHPMVVLVDAEEP